MDGHIARMRIWEKNAKFWSEDLKGRDLVGHLGLAGRKILK
jgi:hypothetical protein